MRTKDSEKQSLNFFLSLLKNYKKNLIFAVLSALFISIFGIISSLALKVIFDEVLFSKATSTLTAIGCGMVLLINLQSIMRGIRNFLLAFFAFDLEASLLFQYFSHILNLPLSFFDSHKVGEIVARIDDVIKLRSSLSEGIMSLLMDIIMFVVIGIVLFLLDATLFLVLVCTIPITSLFIFIFAQLFRKKYPKYMGENASVRSFIVESFSNINNIKSYSAEHNIAHEYELKQIESIKTNWEIFKLHTYQTIFSDFIKQLGILILFWVGATLIMKDSIGIGTLFSFASLSGYFSGSLERLLNLQSSIHEVIVASQRLGEILLLKTEEPEMQFIKPTAFEGKICFQAINFHYPDKSNEYEKFSVTIEPGQWTAFVGATGSGKTTLIKLLMKFYTIDSGEITFDGHNIYDLDTYWLREQIGYVPQDISLFSSSIFDNICLYNNKISLDDVINTAKRTGAHDFICNLPQRYNTLLGEHGMTLSGGERQKIAITRALLHKTKIVIFDEVTSNLDPLSEARINDLILELRNEHITIISISHRLSSIQNADMIYCLSDGKIIESGNHNDLMKIDGYYKKMLESKE